MHNIAMTRIWIVPEKFPKSDVQGSVVDQILDVDIKFNIHKRIYFDLTFLN